MNGPLVGSCGHSSLQNARHFCADKQMSAIQGMKKSLVMPSLLTLITKGGGETALLLTTYNLTKKRYFHSFHWSMTQESVNLYLCFFCMSHWLHFSTLQRILNNEELRLKPSVLACVKSTPTSQPSVPKQWPGDETLITFSHIPSYK